MKNIYEQKKGNFLVHLYEATILNGVYACEKGCSSCCTQSVTITALEGELILSYLENLPKDFTLQPASSDTQRPTLTTNQYVRQFIEQRGDKGDGGGWSLKSCQFLVNGACSIYQVRPFMCRSFVSKSDCRAQGFAEVPPQVVTFNTIVQQIIEHLAVGTPWGLMSDVLLEISNSHQGGGGSSLSSGGDNLVCEKMVGVILSDQEKRQLKNPLIRVEKAINTHCKEQAPDLSILH